MIDVTGRALIAREAMSLAIGFLSVSNLSKAREWSGTASRHGYPGAAELHSACMDLCSAFRAASTASPVSAHVMQELHSAALAVGELMVAAAKALEEQIPGTASGYADGQVLRAAELSFARKAFESGGDSTDP